MRTFVFLLVWNAIIIFGGLAVLRSAPGPTWAGVVLMFSFVAAMGIGMYLFGRRFEGPWRDP